MPSSVEPAAPFIAMPSDIDALSGEMKTFCPFWFLAICRKRANEKSLPDVATICSEPSSVSDGVGALVSEQATASGTNDSANRRDRLMASSSVAGQLA